MRIMDFLDPNKKRSTAIKIAIGNFLMLTLVVVGTFLLVLQTYGFDVNRKTGEVIQNGLVFVDSAPDDAQISINGSSQAQHTNTRLTLPEGNYALEINKPQYRVWKKSFELKGGSIERFNYPTLFLNNLTSDDLQSFDSQVTFFTQSPDRRWLLIGEKNNIKSFTEYDLNTRKNELPISQNITLPDGLFTAAAGNHTLKVVEWSTNNNEALIKHNWTNGQEFVVVNRNKPTESFNINRQLNVNPSSVKLFDKKTDKLYIYVAKSKSLSTIDTKTAQSTAVATGVLGFEPYGENQILMAVANPTDKNNAKIVVSEGKNTYEIREIPMTEKFALAMTSYENAMYVVTDDSKAKRTYIYKDPVSFIKRQPSLKPVPTMVLKSPSLLNSLSFSQNAQFVVAQGGHSFSSYDIEYDKSYNFDIREKIDPNNEVLWMDGHRLITQSNGKVFLFEYDGMNAQSLVSTTSGLPAVFDRDYTELYTIATSKGNKKPSLEKTELRLKEDQ